MDIFSIFEIKNQKLLAFKFPNNDKDEFNRLFELWTDTQYLEEFFVNNKKFLFSGFFSTDFIADFVIRTRNNAILFMKRFYEIAKSSSSLTLDEMFAPLSKDNTNSFYEFRYKAKDVFDDYSVLRIYAIKISSNFYIVTGGGIKLTKAIQDSPLLNKELSKFKECKKFLILKNYL